MLCECEGTGICQKCKGECVVGQLPCDKCGATGKCVCEINKKRKKKQGSHGWFITP